MDFKGLSAYSSVRRIILSRITHLLLGGCTLQRSHVSRYTGNVHFKASKVLHKNGNHSRAVDSLYVAHHLVCHHVLGCLPDIHTHVDAFATYNRMVQGYTENLVTQC